MSDMQPTTAKSRQDWKPNDVLKLTALVGGFLLFLVGAWMLYKGISAQGMVDLRTTLLSGTIRAASAGLYICFFAVFVIVATLATIVTSGRTETNSTPRHHRQIQLFWGMLAALVLCSVGEVMTKGVGFSMATGCLTVSLVWVVLAILRD